jgi:eukaryotic-like serine/threonine-protein kinase
MTAVEIPTPDPRTFDEAARPFAEAVASRYAIKRLIGQGGMGIVYLARDRRLDRLVAIKTLPPSLAADAVVRERFLRETRMAGSLSHPNIVPVHGSDEIDGHVFFVMGYVEGESLAAHVGAHRHLDPVTVARYLHDVAAALTHAHARGVIHRDIKAENILIDRATGRALVTDFGIARLAEAAPLTATGQLLGTVYYVSPEQVSGGVVDARSDVYSLGVVGFLALTGRFPFDAEIASAVLVAHVTRPAPAVRSINPSVPAALATVIDRCLSKDPAQRFQTSEALQAAIDNAMRDDSKKSIARPSHLVSEDEARAVWQRAADLHAATGIRPRPPAVSKVRNASSDAVRTSGYSVEDIRAAALEAGIGSSYVDHALVEHGLGGTRREVTQLGVIESPVKRSLWAGAPLDITLEAEVAGEIHPRHFDRLMNLLRDGTNTLGVTSAKTHALSWRTAWLGHRLDVSVSPQDGRTRIRFVQSLRRAAVGSLGGAFVAGGVGGTLAAFALDVLLRLPAPRGGIAFGHDAIHVIAATVGALIGVACIRLGRGAIRTVRDYNAARLQTLAELTAVRVRDAIDGEGEEQ